MLNGAIGAERHRLCHRMFTEVSRKVVLIYSTRDKQDQRAKKGIKVQAELQLATRGDNTLQVAEESQE